MSVESLGHDESFLGEKPPKRVSPSLIVPRVSYQEVKEGFYYFIFRFNGTSTYCSKEEDENEEWKIFEKEFKVGRFCIVNKFV